MASEYDAARRLAMLGFAGLTGVGAGAFAAGQGRQSGAIAPVQGPVEPRTYGARMDGMADDSEALRKAASTRRVILIEGPMRIDQVVDLPAETMLQGTGVHRARVVLGPKGKLRISGESFERRIGGGVVRDLTISPAGRANQGPGLEMRHIDHFLVDNVIFYRAGVLMDDHHYVSFRDCQFFGEEGRVSVLSNCLSQPPKRAWMSEVLWFSRCFFSACPVELEDTVGARFTDCAMFAGSFGIRSRRRLSRGSDAEPFFMGPTISGCMFDSIDGVAIEIEGGGTDCRMLNNFVGSGRTNKTPGVQLIASSGVELIGNRFEWCGSAGLAIENCEKIGVIGNSFANMASGPGILARRSREVRVIGNAFENRPRWGGSAEGFTTLAIDCVDNGCADWVVAANTASDLRDARVARLSDGLVQNNVGWPAATERGWPAGPSEARPCGVADGYRWYDRTLGLWIHWHRGSGRWRDATGRAV